MRISLILRAAAHGRIPMIKFLGKRTPPKSVDHTPHTHPMSPSPSLPDSFANYRSAAQSHGPLGGSNSTHTSSRTSGSSPSASISAGVRTPPLAYGAIGGHSGAELGPVEAGEGEVFDRGQLPKRFRKTGWSEEEIEAVTSAGASLFG